MKILRLHRVELLIDRADIGAAVAKFNDALGFKINEPHEVPGPGIISAYDFDHGIEFVAPTDETSALYPRLKEKGKGALLCVVWEVESIEDAIKWVKERGLNIVLDYQHGDVRQLCLDDRDFFGYVPILLERKKPV